MGFDIYGLNPNNPNNAVKPKSLDWSEKHTDEEEKDYFNAINTYEEEVVGHYFRNNVWFWRPLWSFVVQISDDILTDKDIMNGGVNSGHKICKTKANRIAARLKKIIDSGSLDAVQKEADESMAKIKKHNDKVRDELDELNKTVKKETGKELAPVDYPEPYKTQWDKTYAKEDWNGHYPFSADNIKEFYQFCKNSGGFEIC